MSDVKLSENAFELLLRELGEGYASFDTWGGDLRAEIYYGFKLNPTKNIYEIGDSFYFRECEESGGIGMGAYPSSVTMRKIDLGAAIKVMRL